ncbi:MAG TPA: hypothetical protein VFT71_05105 [Candidatus Nitrosocosmicus sp.]|nr:hypothetical protein [Candidatus Nitrosocosmicus sp.]
MLKVERIRADNNLPTNLDLNLKYKLIYSCINDVSPNTKQINSGEYNEAYCEWMAI